MNTPADARDLSTLARSHAAPTIAAPPFRWKSRVLLPGVILAVIGTLLVLTAAETIMPAAPIRIVPVVVKTVEGSAGSVTVQAPGWLEPDPHPYYVAALADGVVEEMLVLEGDRIEADQVVARMIDDDAKLALRRAEAVLTQRRATLESARSELAAAKLEIQHLVDRTHAVATAEADIAGAAAELQKARADIDVERAKLLEIEDETDRKTKLVDSQAVAEGTVARLRLRLDAQEAMLEAALARAAIGDAKEHRARAALEAAIKNRDLLIEEHRRVGLAEAAVDHADASVALAEAIRDEAALRLDRMEVRSSVEGIVLTRLASPGSRMDQGSEFSSHILHAYDPQHLQVRVDVPFADAAHVVVGQEAEITVEVLPDRVFKGRVTRVVHQADIQKNTVEVKVAIDSPTAELKPEMLARARFLARETTPDGNVRQRIFAPETLLHADEAGGATTFVVTRLLDGRGRVERRAVVTGTRRIDGWVEVDEGLQIGDLLVADPPADLKPGARVQVVGEQAGGGV